MNEIEIENHPISSSFINQKPQPHGPERNIMAYFYRKQRPRMKPNRRSGTNTISSSVSMMNTLPSCGSRELCKGCGADSSRSRFDDLCDPSLFEKEIKPAVDPCPPKPLVHCNRGMGFAEGCIYCIILWIPIIIIVSLFYSYVIRDFMHKSVSKIEDDDEKTIEEGLNMVGLSGDLDDEEAGDVNAGAVANVGGNRLPNRIGGGDSSGTPGVPFRERNKSTLIIRMADLGF